MSSDSVVFFQTNALLVREVRSHYFASLTFLVWDTLLTFGDEVDCIWSVPWKSKIKWLYIYFRYIVLAAHVAFGLAIVHLTSGFASPSSCRAWVIFEFTLVQVTSTLFEFVLALCVYALYNRSRRIALLLAALIGGEIVSGGFTVRDAVAGMPFEIVCVLTHFPNGNAIYASFVALAQSTLVWLILAKSLLAVRAGGGRSPLVSLLIKRIGATYGLMIAFLSMSFVFILRADSRAVILFLWANSLLATCACRLVIGLERVGNKLETHSQEPVFTSQIEV